MEELEARPESIHIDDPLLPRRPWSFAGEALRGSFALWSLVFMASWALYHLLSSWGFAVRVARLTRLAGSAGGSMLPSYWGEVLSARDLWEVWENGGLGKAPLGFALGALVVLALAWIPWAGWKVQVRGLDRPGDPRLRAGFQAWIWGLADAVLLGALPLWLLGSLLNGALGWMAQTGLQGLGWLDLVGGGVARLCLGSAFLLQWWLCRVARAGSRHRGWLLGSPAELGRHLGDSFLRLWMHPLHWGSIILLGVLLRGGLSLLVLLYAWHWGGGSSLRVALFLVLQLLAILANAWCIGWMLRLSARFWAQDARVRAAVRALRQRSRGSVEVSGEA